MSIGAGGGTLEGWPYARIRGSAARTGKGTLMRRLAVEMQMPYLSIDVLNMGLTRGVPEFDIDPNAGSMIVAEKLWPLVREMSINLLGEAVNYGIEGELLPKHVDAFRREYPSQIKACFLGYATIAPTQKLREIRTFSGHPNDWPSTYADSDLLKIIAREIAFSQYLMNVCAEYNLRYFDMSHDFLATLDQVVAYIRAR